MLRRLRPFAVALTATAVTASMALPPVAGPASAADTSASPAAADTARGYPLPTGRYTPGTPFGQPGPLWASGYHTGTDFEAAVGTPVLAAATGVVSAAGPTGGPYGTQITVRHPDGHETTYAHLSDVFVDTGVQVNIGQAIGAVGVTGNTTGPHLHFEVFVNGQRVDPSAWLAGAVTFATPTASAQLAGLQAQIDDLGRQIVEAETAIAEAEKRHIEAKATADRLRAEVAAAQTRRDAAQATVTGYARSAYMLGDPQIAQSVAALHARTPTEFADTQTLIDKVGTTQSEKLLAAIAYLEDLKKKEAAAIAAEQEASRNLAAAQQKASALRAQMAQVALDLASRMRAADALYAAEEAAQQARNAEVAKQWSDYLASLAAAQVPPFSAAQLASPARLPAGLVPLLGPDGKPEPGVATWKATGLLVLPKEAIDATTKASTLMGRTYLWGGTGPDMWDCSAVSQASWGAGGQKLGRAVTDQAAAVTLLPATAVVRPGDLIFMTHPTAGLHHVGVAVSSKDMIAANAADGTVLATAIPADRWGAGRPTLGAAPKKNPLPAAAKDTPPMRCGAPASTGSGEAWGGFTNGFIPSRFLCPLEPFPTHRLRCDAAKGYNALSAEYNKQFNSPLCLTDSYRDYRTQVVTREKKGHLAAIPGTSNHGWGLAVDLAICTGSGLGGIGFSSPQYQWLTKNAPRYGWVHPPWAQAAGSKPEPWHWEFGVIS